MRSAKTFFHQLTSFSSFIILRSHFTEHADGGDFVGGGRTSGGMPLGAGRMPTLPDHLDLGAERGLGIRDSFSEVFDLCHESGERSLKQSAELVWGDARILRNGTHGEGVDGIVARNGESSFAVAHYDVATLPRYAVAQPLEHSDGVTLADAGELRHLRDLTPSPTRG